MADDGSAPRGTPPPRPSSRSPSPTQDVASPPSSTEPLEQQRQHPEAAEKQRVSGWDAIARRVLKGSLPTSTYEGSFTARDAELNQLRRVIAEYRHENDSLGEAVVAMKRALDASNAARGVAEAERDAARGRGETARGDQAESRGLLAAAEVETRDLKASLDDVEQLAVDLQDDLKTARAAVTAAEAARAEAERHAADSTNTATSAAEEAAAAAAMAEELRDRVAHLERDGEVRASQHGITEALEVALAEARAAASSAASDRDTLATSWRREWEAAKEDHAAELRALRARVAATEGDLAGARDDRRRERATDAERRRETETALAEAQLGARRSKSDQHGAAETLRLMVSHEDVLREAARHQSELVGRLRGDAAGSAARCERVAGHCAALMRERDAVLHRAEAAEAAETRARDEARHAWGHPMAPLVRAVNSAPGNGATGSGSETGAGYAAGTATADAIPSLLAAAVRQSHRSPRSFAAGMNPGGGGGGISPPSAANHSPNSSPGPGPGSTTSPRTVRWVDSIGSDVAEELVHALAREVAESRVREEHQREQLAAARDKRDDAQRALLTEVHRVHELERMRVVDLREVCTLKSRPHTLNLKA